MLRGNAEYDGQLGLDDLRQDLGFPVTGITFQNRTRSGSTFEIDAEQVASVFEDGQLRPLDRDKPDFEKDQIVVTFDELTARSPFVLRF